jgi:hypothetical protein
MIKKHSNKNHYLSTPEGIWVRDFTTSGLPYLDLNSGLFDGKDYQTIVNNELKNKLVRIPQFQEEGFAYDTVCIMSDGYQAKEKIKQLETADRRTCLIAINHVLDVWSPTSRRIIDFYVTNNPYPAAMNCFPKALPKQKLPRLIASTRTNSDFIRKYPAIKYFYTPVPDKSFGMTTKSDLMIDDYRNPVCAALVLAFHMKAKKIVLFCCDDCFPQERAGGIPAREGMWMYPSHLKANHIIDACCFWLKKRKVEVIDHSSGPVYQNASYIEIEKVADYLGGNKERDE